MKIRNNLSADDEKVLKEIISDPSIVICPADKGKAIVTEDRDTYPKKMQEQIDEGDYKLDNRKEKTLLDKLHKKPVEKYEYRLGRFQGEKEISCVGTSFRSYVPSNKSS